MLVTGDRGGRGAITADDPKSRLGFAPKPAGLALHGLTQNLCERDTTPTSLALQDCEVVAFSCHGRSPDGHASDASIINPPGSAGALNLVTESAPNGGMQKPSGSPMAGVRGPLGIG